MNIVWKTLEWILLIVFWFEIVLFLSCGTKIPNSEYERYISSKKAIQASWFLLVGIISPLFRGCNKIIEIIIIFFFFDFSFAT